MANRLMTSSGLRIKAEPRILDTGVTDTIVANEVLGRTYELKRKRKAKDQYTIILGHYNILRTEKRQAEKLLRNISNDRPSECWPVWFSSLGMVPCTRKLLV